MKIKQIYILLLCTNLKFKKKKNYKLVGVNSGIKSSIFRIEDIKSSEN